MSDLGSRTCIDANECGTTENKPSESQMLPALDENFYRCQVEPVFDRLCAQLACHGVEPDLNANPADVGRALRTYHRGRLRVTGETLQGESGCLNQPDQNSEDCIGGLECACWTKPHLPTEWQRNFDSARGLGLKPNGEPLAAPEDSDLLVQPLVGTDPPAHAGMKMWSENDLEYKTVLEWLEGKTQAQCTTTN